jgi:16S rRNA (guanine966-N2)-methyltransferase
LGWLRIIAGELRGRRIAVPPGGTIRPTSDRAREALFSILGAEVAGARVLDAYAGTGALGFEALSRGAASAVFVEADGRAATGIEETAGRLGLSGRVAVARGAVVDLLRRGFVPGPFALILADPPYADPEREAFLEAAIGVLAPGGLLVVERDARSEAAEAIGLRLVRTAAYGRCRLDFYRVSVGGPAASGPG